MNEDENLKGSVTIEAEKNIKNDKVFASNTSTIPITTLAEKSNSPENFIGVHFFSPVNRMKLVEIIKGEKTSPYALAKAFDYAQKIGVLSEKESNDIWCRNVLNWLNMKKEDLNQRLKEE